MSMDTERKQGRFVFLRRLAGAAVLFVLTVLLSAGCGQAPEAGRQYKVYFIAKSLDTQFWMSAVAGANAARSEYNLELLVMGPDTEEDYEEQNAFIHRAVTDRADAIIFSAISYTENAAAIDEAADAGVKIVVIDSDVDSEKVSARIGTDNILAGRMTAAAALDTDEEEIFAGIVNFDLGSRNGQEREQGLRQALQEDARVKSVSTVNVPTSAIAARTGAEILLSEHPEINVLIGLNEPLAVGVGLAVEELGLKDSVRAVGFDTNINCVDMMRDGVMDALIAQNPYAMGYLGVETAWSLIEGLEYDPHSLIDTSTTIVDRDNMFSEEGQRALFAFE